MYSLYTKRTILSICIYLIFIMIQSISGGSPKSGTSSMTPPCFADACATSPGTVNLAASHALTFGSFPDAIAEQKSSIRSAWEHMCPLVIPW